MVQDYVQAKTWGKVLPLGRMIAHMGDAEQDDGNTYEGLQEDGKNDLRDTWQVTEYNRIVTSSPDVTGTTNLGQWVNPRKLSARIGTNRHVQRS